MSTCKVTPSKAAGTSLDYAWYGDSGRMKIAHLEAGTSRVAAFRSSMGNEPTEALRQALEQAAEDHGRRNQLYVYTLAFHPDEFDVTNPDDLDRIADVGSKLAERMHSADYAVVVHADAKGGHGHAHIYVVNHDNITGKSLQRNTSWVNGVRQINDELMRDEGLRVERDPTKELADWTHERERFEPGGFEQTLGDRIAASLRDPRCTDRDQFATILAEHDVRLETTKQGEHRYKMRHPTSNRLMSKAPSRLTPEFGRDGTAEIFNFHQQRAGQSNGNPGRDASRGTGRTATFRPIANVERLGDADRAADRAADRHGGEPERHRSRRGAASEVEHVDNGESADGNRGTEKGSGTDHTKLRVTLQRQREQRRKQQRERDARAGRDRKNAHGNDRIAELDRTAAAELKRANERIRRAGTQSRDRGQSQGYGLGD